MMTSSNGNIFRLLAIYVRNSPVTSEYPKQRPVMRSIDIFFDLHLNKCMSEAGGLRRHRAYYDITVMKLENAVIFIGNHHIIWGLYPDHLGGIWSIF